MNRRSFVLVAVLLSTLSVPLTITGSSIALPSLRLDLGASLTTAQWVVNGYNVAFAASLTFAGSVADALGRRRAFTAGIVLFVVGSLVCALAGSVSLLNVARVLAGAGAAAGTAAGASLLAATFDGPARTRAFGLLGTVLGVGLALGPTVSGYLVSTLGWRAVFVPPIVLSTLVLTLCPLLPRPPAPVGRRMDWIGGAFFTAGLVLVIVVLVEAPALGIADPLIFTGLLAAIGCAVGFVRAERRTREPMFDFGLLTNRRFLGYAVAAGSLMGLLVPLLVYLPSYLITVVGLDSGRSGLWLLALTLPSVALPTVGAVIARHRPALLVVGSVALSGVGVALLTSTGGESGFWEFAPSFLALGTGVGLTTGVVDGLAVSAVRPDHSGTAAGIFNTARLATETVALAGVGAVLAALGGGRLEGEGFTTALHAVCAALGLLAICAAAVVATILRSATTPDVTSGGREAP